MIAKVTGSVTATEYDVMSTVLREPIGVVGCISPWNYPLLMALWKISPSLAAGNSTILKPAEQSPMSCYRVAELFVEAGGPAGALLRAVLDSLRSSLRFQPSLVRLLVVLLSLFFCYNNTIKFAPRRR